MDTKNQPTTGTVSLAQASTRFSSLGAHTAAPNILPSPARTGSLSNRGGGARPLTTPSR